MNGGGGGGRNGLIPERKARTRGYDWQEGRRWTFDLETYAKVLPCPLPLPCPSPSPPLPSPFPSPAQSPFLLHPPYLSISLSSSLTISPPPSPPPPPLPLPSLFIRARRGISVTLLPLGLVDRVGLTSLSL